MGQKPKARKPPPQKTAQRPVARGLPERVGLDRRPIFSLEHADKASQHSFTFDLDEANAKAVLDYLHTASKCSWSELRAETWANKRGAHRRHHEHSIERICDEAQSRISATGLDEIIPGPLFRFRISAKERLWGFVVDGIFHVIWWDPEHAVYPTEPG